MKKLTEEQSKIVEDNMNLVYFVINRYWKSQPQSVQEELYQEGCLALINACIRYNENIGKFSTYAVKCIHFELIKKFTTKIGNQFKVDDKNYKQALENVVMRLDKKDNEGMYISDIIDDKNDELEKFINKYSAKQQARWVMRFASEEDYQFLLKYTNNKVKTKGNRKEIAKNYKRFQNLTRLARMYNKGNKFNEN